MTLKTAKVEIDCNNWKGYYEDICIKGWNETIVLSQKNADRYKTITKAILDINVKNNFML